uniref:Uncharacterized protein n=1 Tax=Anguilla anguilla TaxID=7936 RepID=A0A0E9UMI5_ANGAN
MWGSVVYSMQKKIDFLNGSRKTHVFSDFLCCTVPHRTWNPCVLYLGRQDRDRSEDECLIKRP